MQSKINAFKVGRFSPLITRAYSLNTFIGSKLIYRTSVIDLTKTDLGKITLMMRSWLFQDCFIKPDYQLSWRLKVEGGLGVHHPGSRAQALLTVTFIQFALGTIGKPNGYLNTLFRTYVLDEPPPKGLKRSPFYSAEFFNTIKVTKNDHCISSMTAGDWYRAVLKRNITHVADANGMALIPSKQEIKFTGIAWEVFWHQIGIQGLCPDLKLFLWKLAANMLPVGTAIQRPHIPVLGRVTRCSCCRHSRCQQRNVIFAAELLGPNTDILQVGLSQMDCGLGHGLAIS